MESNEIKTDDPLLRDHLALERTVLANERTLLAYVRTFLAIVITAISFLHFLQEKIYHWIAFLLFPLSLFILFVGIIRYLSVRKKCHL
ncbi:DUF202 domain-containing protein [candidate division KSB1 bacterium]|nr:DUF202 domain-containing protein [candidate division KSB1 bacterium]